MKLTSENLNINLRHLKALFAIHRQGTFARAAEELGVVPSALTETVRQLEEEIGVPFFDRSIRPPAPTAINLQLLRETAPLLEKLDQALTGLRMQANLEEGLLTIGSAPSAISSLVGPALSRFRAAYPKIRCRVHDDVAERLAELLLDGTLDLAIAGRARPTPDIRHTLLSEDRFGLACSARHSFASRAAIRLEEIDPDEIISLDELAGTQQLLAACPTVPSTLRNGPMQAHSTVAQLCMIRADLGVGLLPEQAVKLFGDSDICFVSIEDLDLSRSLYLLETKARARSHVADAFLSELRAVTTELDYRRSAAPPQT